jgi:preprotein translocase subunit SecG
VSTYLVSADPANLKRADALIHIGYEIGGTAGAFAGALFVNKLSFVYSTGIVAILFLIACILFGRITPHASSVKTQQQQHQTKVDVNGVNTSMSCQDWVESGLRTWCNSMRIGARVVFTRQFIWLIPCYIVPLCVHRLYENNIFPYYAKNVLQDGSVSGAMLGASNLGELFGAALVLRYASSITSPRPFIRFDAICMSAIWALVYVGYGYPSSHAWITVAWLVPLIIPVSLGFAAGDVSLLAHVQSTLLANNANGNGDEVLACVMSFLYTGYILLMIAMANIVGTVFDHYKAANDVQGALFWICGVMMTILGVIIFACTYIASSTESSSSSISSTSTDSSPTRAASASVASSTAVTRRSTCDNNNNGNGDVALTILSPTNVSVLTVPSLPHHHHQRHDSNGNGNDGASEMDAIILPRDTSSCYRSSSLIDNGDYTLPPPLIPMSISSEELSQATLSATICCHNSSSRSLSMLTPLDHTRCVPITINIPR